MAHMGYPEDASLLFSTTKALRLPYWPSAVLIFSCTFLTSAESIFSVVSSTLLLSVLFWSLFILFSLQTLSLMLRISTD